MTQRIVAIDVETAPPLVWSWSLRPDYIQPEMVEQDAHMLCFAAKAQGQKRAEFYSVHHDGVEKMTAELWRILDEADTVLHFNGKTFDMPWCKQVLVKGGYGPPSPVHQIDLYQQSKQFRLLSHRLEWVSTHLVESAGKEPSGGWALWRKVIDGDAQSWAKFKRYNVRDVDVLWEVYDELLPWLKVPNQNLWLPPEATGPVCPKCGKATLQRRGEERTRVSKYHRLWCNPNVGGCGAWSRELKRIDGAEVVAVA